MKRIFLGVIALACFGTATAQVQAPAEQVPADSAQQQAPADAAQPPYTPTHIVKRTTPRTGLITAVAAGVLVVAAVASGGGDDDDRPSSP
jgi:septum formation inhibitor MinC